MYVSNILGKSYLENNTGITTKFDMDGSDKNSQQNVSSMYMYNWTFVKETPDSLCIIDKTE